MRILHVVYSLVPGAYRGGISKIVFELAQAQAAEGHEVTIFTTDLNGGVKHGLQDMRPSPKFCIRYFEGKRLPRFSSPAMFAEMKRSRGLFDVVHSHNNFLEFNVYVRRAFVGFTRIFFQAHGSLDPIVMRKGLLKAVKKSIYFNFVERRNLLAATGMFASTESEVLQLRKLGLRCPVHVMPNGIAPVSTSVAAGKEFRERHGIKEEKLIAYVGRIHWKKGVDRLIRAFAMFSRDHSGYGLVIGGPWEQYGKYGLMVRNLCHELGVADRIYWLGFVDEIEKGAILSAATIFSHVSESEGMAMAILDAMSAGLPVVVGEGCYMQDAARNGALIEIPPSDELLADVFARIASDPLAAAAMGQQARSYAETHHSWREIAKRSVKIYSGVE